MQIPSMQMMWGKPEERLRLKTGGPLHQLLNRWENEGFMWLRFYEKKNSR